MSGLMRNLFRKNKVDENYSKFSQLITYQEYVELKKKNPSKKESFILGKKVKITDSFWYLHSLNELFVEEVYKFNSNKVNPRIIDCGSNLGFSIIYFKKLFPEANITGFEPDNDICEMAKHNLLQFDIKDVDLQQKAVWINNDPLIFAKLGSLSGHFVDEEADNTIKIETVRLKDYLQEKVDFLKIDIEGPEFDIIKDCKDDLKNVENIFVEYHSFAENPQMIGELLMHLKEAGFKLYLKEAWENMKNPYIEKKGPYFDLQLNIFGYRL
jgi:FkbM family methyltransferase